MELNLPFPPTPENAPRFAALAVEAALTVDDAVLDYSPATLPGLERILQLHRGDHRAASVILFGCYLGEVFVRAAKGRWRATDDTPMKGMADVPLLVELLGGDYCNPIGRVRRFIDEGPGDGLMRFWEAFGGVDSGPPAKPWWRRLLGW